MAIRNRFGVPSSSKEYRRLYQKWYYEKQHKENPTLRRNRTYGKATEELQEEIRQLREKEE